MLNSENKKIIDELVVRYKLEPKIRDIYVEGKRDKTFYDRILKEMGIKNVIIYRISSVEITEEYYPKKNLKLKGNNRNKNIYLADRLESKDVSPDRVKCIIDSDFDFILQKQCNNKFLLFTDYTCLEMYFYNKETLEKFLEITLGGFPYSASHILSQCSKILPDLFLIRLANKILDLNMTLRQFRKCCSCVDCEMSLDINDYIQRCLTSNNCHSRLEEFKEIIEEYRNNLTEDPRKQIHLDDFVELLSYLINECGKKEHKKFCDADVLEGSLKGCFEVDFLEEVNIFNIIKEWSNINSN